MGDDPFSLADLPEDKDDKAYCLEGIYPDKYNGEHIQTTRFLNMFNQFMLMNYKADIAKDPVMRSLYFLSLLKGPKCKGWVDMADKWLQLVIDDPSIIPCWSNIWLDVTDYLLLHNSFPSFFVLNSGPVPFLLT